MIPYTPQQNGIIEKKNKIIMKMARCMLRNLPSFLWGEAMSTTIYTLNRCLTKAIEGKTPFEAWSGNKLNISHLRVFGCEAFFYIISKKIKSWIKELRNASLWAMIINIEDTSCTLHPIEEYSFQRM